MNQNVTFQTFEALLMLAWLFVRYCLEMIWIILSYDLVIKDASNNYDLSLANIVLT